MEFKYKIKHPEETKEQVQILRGAKLINKTNYRIKGSPILKNGKKYYPGDIIFLTLKEARYLDDYVERIEEEDLK